MRDTSPHEPDDWEEIVHEYTPIYELGSRTHTALEILYREYHRGERDLGHAYQKASPQISEGARKIAELLHQSPELKAEVKWLLENE